MSGLRLSRRRFLGTTSGLAAAAAAGIYPNIAIAQGKRVLKARLVRDISSLDPAYMVGGSEVDVQKAVMPCLADYSFEGGRLGWAPTAYVSHLAQRDDTHIDFTLKPGFQWTNGFGELTAEDVKYSFERMLEGDWSGNWEVLDHVEVTDTYSGTLVLKQPFVPIWLNTIAGNTGLLVCKKATEAAGGKYTTEIPATCGPYLYEWTPKQRIVFTPNPDWAGPKPDFDEINYINVEEDQAAELAYEAGELDISRITAPTYARYKQSSPPPDSKLHIAGALQYMWLGMNTEHPKLQDIRVRKAIQHAVDVESILQGAYSGVTERAYGIVPPPLPGKRDTTKLDYNPDKSRALLAEAGVSGLEVELKTLNVQARVLAAQVIQANLAAVGVTANVIPLDSGPFWDMGQESKGDAWKDLQLWLMRYGSEVDPFGPFQWFVRGQVGIWNWERWSDDEFEDLYQKGLVEIDVDKRHQIYVRMQEIMEDTGAYVWITHEPEVFVHRSSLEPVITPDGNVLLHLFKAV
jgi:peptide/nickel transport system substrate-binding protein